MKLIKKLKHTTEKNRIITDLDILIYSDKIIWYMVETIKSNDEEFTEDQPLDDYIKNGPPEFVENLPDDLIKEIDQIIK